MLNKRVIPCLLLSSNGIVKTINFKYKTYIGDPINTIRIFNDKEVDELVILDIDASKNKSGPNFDVIEKISNECFIPLAYGGGISNINDVYEIFKRGVEKVIINTGAIGAGEFILDIVKRFGSQSIVISVDIKKNIFGQLKISSSKKIRIPPLEYIDYMQSLGIGEILINDVDRDGIMNGMNLDLIRTLSTRLNIPLIACGGVGSLNHIRDAFIAGASAVAVGSYFIYSGALRGILISYPSRDELASIIL
jgi:cyclase